MISNIEQAESKCWSALFHRFIILLLPHIDHHCLMHQNFQKLRESCISCRLVAQHMPGLEQEFAM